MAQPRLAGGWIAAAARVQFLFHGKLFSCGNPRWSSLRRADRHLEPRFESHVAGARHGAGHCDGWRGSVRRRDYGGCGSGRCGAHQQGGRAVSGGDFGIARRGAGRGLLERIACRHLQSAAHRGDADSDGRRTRHRAAHHGRPDHHVHRRAADLYRQRQFARSAVSGLDEHGDARPDCFTDAENGDWFIHRIGWR